MKFNKPPLSLPDQVAKLKNRGLTIQDESAAKAALLRVGYYRLSAYALPFQHAHTPAKPFVAGTRLEDVLALYAFDCELRSLVLGALERVEVALRSVTTNHMCLSHGAHWFMEPRLFAPAFKHDDLLERLEKDLGIPQGDTKPDRPHSEVFINHYYARYGDPYLPPAWMVSETLSLGTSSLIYASLGLTVDKNAIAAFFGYDQAILIPWLHTLAYVRNICAHHSRLWNRKLVIKAPIPKKHAIALRIQAASADRFYAVAVVLFDLLRAVDPTTHWNHRLTALIAHHTVVRPRMMEMGFPVPWKNDPFWNLKTVEPDAACWI